MTAEVFPRDASSLSKITLKARKGITDPAFESISLSPPNTIYFMGICGTAMASLAVLLKSKGFSVFGSDENIYPPMSLLLKQKEIPIRNYNSDNINSSIKLVILGNVISRTHPEVFALEKHYIPYTSFSEFLEAALLKDKQNIVISGTHGKTTTTSLMAHVASQVGKKPGFFIGGLPRDFKTSFQYTHSKWFVIEGDEYDTAFFAKWPKFFHYNPFALILTGVEFDHGDIYKDFQDILQVFFKLAATVPLEGCIIACIENKGVQEVLENAEIKARVLTYGINSGDFQIKNPYIKEEKSHFEILHNKKTYPLSLNLFGEHNILNALAVFSLSFVLKWPLERVSQAFHSFQGVKRRLEKLEDRGGVLLMEDFAHHPTAVKMTLEGVKRAFPERRLTAVFEPRSFTSCLNIFQEDYVKALAVADKVAIGKPYREANQGKGLSAEKLAEDIKALGKEAFFSENSGDLASQLLSLVKPGDILLIMSNGNFDSLTSKLKQGLQERFP